MNLLHTLSKPELAAVIRGHRPRTGVMPDLDGPLFRAAREAREPYFGHRVLLRGLVEVSSFCAQDCRYCGLRRSNGEAARYRLTSQDILACCREGHALGLRTFVLQGGEDGALTDTMLCALIADIKAACPGSAVTLSLGERSRESYAALRAAGADRYLLRHETADATHYGVLHPAEQTLESRKNCLYTLKELGFQVGAGFMVGSPGQSAETLAEDLIFLRELEPHMVGIGPFMPHHATPFADAPAGTVGETLLMLALTRLLLPAALLPSTTALASLHPRGRILGLEAGGNVVMPNLSPPAVRADYSIYDNKRATGSESAEGLALLCAELQEAGYQPDLSRGDSPLV